MNMAKIVGLTSGTVSADSIRSELTGTNQAAEQKLESAQVSSNFNLIDSKTIQGIDIKLYDAGDNV